MWLYCFDCFVHGPVVIGISQFNWLAVFKTRAILHPLLGINSGWFYFVYKSISVWICRFTFFSTVNKILTIKHENIWRWLDSCGLLKTLSVSQPLHPKVGVSREAHFHNSQRLISILSPCRWSLNKYKIKQIRVKHNTVDMIVRVNRSAAVDKILNIPASDRFDFPEAIF